MVVAAGASLVVGTVVFKWKDVLIIRQNRKHVLWISDSYNV